MKLFIGVTNYGRLRHRKKRKPDQVDYWRPGRHFSIPL
jgi:hypothetical protein